jgi:hypothetical protein
LALQVDRERVGGGVDLGRECGEVLEVVCLDEGFAGSAVLFNGGPETLDEPFRERETQPRSRKPLSEFVFEGKLPG